MHKTFSRVIASLLVVMLAFLDVAANSPAAVADATPTITLNGTVSQEDPGSLNSKAIVLSSGNETKVNYRLVPDYARGAATDVRVTLFLPSLEHVDGEYRVVDRDREPTPLGVQGRVSGGDGWTVLSESATARGGRLLLQYDGDLRPGINPAFDIYLSTYNDGSEGVYGGVPDGTAFEINGFVSYEMFDRAPGSSWETPRQLDDHSRVSVISSDLRWEPTIEPYVPDGGSALVPIWDRYQYVDYRYTLRNTSENPASKIDGYSVTLDIDSTDSSVNGIIPFDINRWIYHEGSAPTLNDDIDNAEGLFVGVPGEGGLLIYDITDWDGESELTDEIPYSYSGTGMIVIDREHGAAKQELTPEATPGATERSYLVSMPLSRQGFPNPPTMFKVRAITNILFAKTANWSKTRVSEREVAAPTYDLSFTHTTKQPDVVYGYETYNEITDIRSASNAPMFRPRVDYAVDSEFAVDRVTYEFDAGLLDLFGATEISYPVTDPETGETTTRTLRGTAGEPDEDSGRIALSFDLSGLADEGWDRTLSLPVGDRVDVGATVPLDIKVHGTPYRLGTMTATATGVFAERIASNDDYGRDTTYTEVEHEKAIDAAFEVVTPKEVVPSIRVRIDGTDDRATVAYGAASVIDLLFGVNDSTAQDSTTTLTLNTSAETVSDATLILKRALFAHAENVRVRVTTLDGDEQTLDLGAPDGSEDLRLPLPARVATVVIDTDELSTDGPLNLVSVTATIGHGLQTEHTLTGTMRTYQPKPFDKNATKDATGVIDIRLPNELAPAVDVVGVYGDRRTPANTYVPYEAPFQAEYQLSTGGILAPTSRYAIDMLAPTTPGSLSVTKITLTDAYLEHVTDPVITFLDATGEEQSFTTREVDVADVTLDGIAKIIVSGTDLTLASLQTIAVVEYASALDMGSSQQLRAAFSGTQLPPYTTSKTATKTNTVSVLDTSTGVEIEGVNQVAQPLGAGSTYDMRVKRYWSCSYPCSSKWDYTLDQGYKSLGGFTASVTRPSATYHNNDQLVTLDVTLPHTQFDLYYLKLRDELRPYLQDVRIYRTVDGAEQLWRTVDGDQWVDNTAEGEGYWRIATARPDSDDLFTTHDGTDLADHPYYKDPWDPDVRPAAPVSRVVVTLEFQREGANAVPHLAGTHKDVVEYMGRFPATSVDGKKPTRLAATDAFGHEHDLVRTQSPVSIDSLVAYPYAQTRTGAEDSTSLANKVITMGEEGHYLASIWNVDDASWTYNNGHGPDVHTPAATELDEWLRLYDPASFHDELVYEFVYPDGPDDDPLYHLDPTDIVLPQTSALRHLTHLRVHHGTGDDESVELALDDAMRARLQDAAQLRIVYDDSLPEGFHVIDETTLAVSLGEDRYPTSFEATFTHIDGFGDRTAEIDGVAPDTMGAGLAEIDVRVGGVVNGNKALRGTTNLYRDPDDTARTLLHTSSATLTGYTPKAGAAVGMRFDAMSVYDYQQDGVTPNTTTIEADLANTAEADLAGFTLHIDPDSRFRSQIVAIPQEIFDGVWSATAVTIRQGATAVAVDLDEFRLNPATGRYELDLLDLFERGILTSTTEGVTFGGAATLVTRSISRISVTFAAAVDEDEMPLARLWGSLAVPAEGETLPKRMIEGGYVFVTGVWVDETADGAGWDSKPTFKAQGAKSDTSVQVYSAFTVSASDLKSVQRLVTSAGGGNSGLAPTLTRNSGNAPALYTRVAILQSHAVHLTNDLTRASGSAFFYDADTGAQIEAGNIAVGDTATVLYELRNAGTAGTAPNGAGNLPVRDPIAHIEAPKGLDITDVQVVTAGGPEAVDQLVDASGRTVIRPAAGQFAISRLTSKRADVAFDDVQLRDQESVYFLVRYTAVNDIGPDLDDTQNVALQWNAYARPAYLHHVMNFVVTGVSGNGATGTSRQINVDGDGTSEHLAWLYPSYRYANPSKLRIASRFDVESLSGTGMTLTVSGIENEILHSNTRADLYITLDTNATAANPVSGFELTELPTPAYPDGFTGEFDAPKVRIRDAAGEWVTFDPALHDLADVTQLRIEYGALPARAADGSALRLPDVAVHGIGHWRTLGAATTKSYQIASRAQIVLTHLDGARDDQPVAEYAFTHSAAQTLYKGIPVVEFNLQSFDTPEQALRPYTDATAAEVGKTDYRPGDPVSIKVTARNHSTPASTHTGSGKAPLRDPVVFDKVPEYITLGALEAFVHDGTLDVAAAVEADALVIRHYSAAGALRDDVGLPAVTVEDISGLDVAGAQTFGNGRHNDGWGRLSTTEPVNTTANPTARIDFRLFTYTFPDDLGRGERIEIVYTGAIRTDDLPIARYPGADGKDGPAVYAPLFGWYGSNSPTAANANGVAMDMAALLHDAGISGDRGHELTSGEFLTGSSAWLPGSTATRRAANSNSSSYQDTYYDASADSERTHRGYLQERTAAPASTLYEAASGGAVDDNYAFALTARVDDGVVTHPERILWAQDAMQLSRAWLYGASEMVPDIRRSASGTSDANFYEHDGTLSSYNLYHYGYNAYVEDDYTYAVQLDERFTVRLHATNLGDHPVTSGIEYLEVLPPGISPYDEDGKMLGVTAYDGDGREVDADLVDVKVLQEPGDERVYAAPAQSQEAGTYRADGTLDDVTPYVVRVRVRAPLAGMFHADTATTTAKHQRVDIRVRVAEERPAGADGKSYWYDQLTVTSIAREPYLEIYGAEYGAFDLAHGYYNRFRFPDDGMVQGADVTDLRYDFGSYTSYVSFEPYGRYIRGLNAQGTRTTRDDKPALVTGDRIAMRVPTLRVWNSVTKDAYTDDYDASIQDYTVDLYERFTIDATVQNQQIETQNAYIRGRSGYDYSSSDHLNDDVWRMQPQTIGGARGSWFDPTVTVALPYGIVPVLENGDFARYSDPVSVQQDVDFTASVSRVTYRSSTPERDVSDAFDVTVERLDDAAGTRFLLHFTPKDDAAARAVHEIAYGEALTVSPRVVTVDSPSYGDDTDETTYQEILTLAHSERPVFTPIVSTRHATGSVPQGLDGVYDASLAGGTPFANDHFRADSTSTWRGEMGALKITERLISATKAFTPSTAIALHTDGRWTAPARTLLPDEVTSGTGSFGAYGGTRLKLKHATIVNTTTAARYPDAATADIVQVDPAGTHWISTEVRNRPVTMENPFEQILTAGDVHNSRLLVTAYVTGFAERTGQARLVVDGEVLDSRAWKDRGYTVEEVEADPTVFADGRRRLQWIVTTPDEGTGTFGKLRSGQSVTLRVELRLVDGFTDDVIDDEVAWRDPSLTADTYVSLLPADRSLVTGPQRTEDFIVQPVQAMRYEKPVAESADEPERDIDADGELTGRFAWDPVEIQILKPKAEVRVNTARPRLAYTNGLTGDTYFNSSDTIEYLVTHARITGSALTQFVVESILPTDRSDDPSVPVSDAALDTSTLSVSSGAWELPQETLQRLAAAGKSIDDVFETQVLISREHAQPGYEAGEWVLLGTGSITTNIRYDIPEELREAQQKMRVVVRSLDRDFLLPTGLRLAVDADPETPGMQDVLETDPDNRSTSTYPATVTDHAISISMRAASDKKATLFIYDTAQAWGTYVADAKAKLAQSETRSYLTPSRPVLNVLHDARYYRVDSTRPTAERFGWSDVTAINPVVSPHLKFRGEVVNADRSMWSREEDNTYAEDTLIDPVVTFELPTVMSMNEPFTYVPADKVTPGHPLSDDHRTPYPLTEKDAYQWTWKLVHADGSTARPESWLTHTRIHTGAWDGLDRNVVTVWFDGMVYPGDMIVVEFIGLIDAYATGAGADDLKSTLLVKNNTGLVQPLNSLWNSANRLGYTTDRVDLDDNALLNDRLVFAERSLFQYETYDDFGKRKTASSDLNRAGTLAPGITPVREGGTFSYEVSLANTKAAGSSAYPYPIIYDVLPFPGDTSIKNPAVSRQSQSSSVLVPESLRLRVEGTENRTFRPDEYTVYVGPFTMSAGRIVSADPVTPADAGSESFYDALGTPGAASAVRDAHFVTLTDLVAAAQTRPDLLTDVRSILVLFTDPAQSLPGESKLILSYDMTSPLNAPVYLEQTDEVHERSDYEQWNSFMATQRAQGFLPQESNNAGVFVTEQAGTVSIGNYVWHDANYNGEQDEGATYVDGNGRTLLRPSEDYDFDGEIDDPGIDGVTVTLLTAAGNHVDAKGNPIHEEGDQWVVVDEATGRTVRDDLGQATVSEGPLTTVTRSDVHGNAGYYVFSNIAPGTYRVMFEFPDAYDRYSVTTAEVFARAALRPLFRPTGVEVYLPGESANVPAGAETDALVAITDAAEVTTSSTDAERMSFDLGVAEQMRIGGTIFLESPATLNGLRDAGEVGIAGYRVHLKDMDGDIVRDHHGEPLIAETHPDGTYEFTFLPRERRYVIEVTDRDDGFTPEVPVSPMIHTVDPFERAGDNDGVTPKGTRLVTTNPLDFGLRGLFASSFADRMTVDVGFYERVTTGVIGNRVWDDRNRDGIQDADEPGIAGQTMRLEQYEQSGDAWERNVAFTRTAVSNADGYYYFAEVPSVRYDGAGEERHAVELRYQVVVDELVPGYVFAPARAGDAEHDSDFFMNGTMHESGAVGDALISIVEYVDDGPWGRDDNTIDLGLMAHDLSSLSGEIFVDDGADGRKTGDALAEPRYTATLQVRSTGAWADVRQDADGVMIEPGAATAGTVMRREGINAYRFDGLRIYDDRSGRPYEYRVVVTDIPLWLPVTAQGVGVDDAVDSDFVQDTRTTTFTAASEAYRLVAPIDGAVLGYDTRTGVPANHVDLGLVPQATTATIGDLVWHDRDEDGMQDAGEPGLQGVPVTLYRVVDDELVRIAAAATDASGRYALTAAVADTDPASATYTQPYAYVVELTLSSRQTLTAYRAGEDDTLGSAFVRLGTGAAQRYAYSAATPSADARHAAVVPTPITLVAADAQGSALFDTVASVADVDGGLLVHETGRLLGDTVFDDRDRDGVQDDGEPGISGVRVELYRLDLETGTWAAQEDLDGRSTLVTDAAGSYLFHVEAADLDKASPHYREPYEYRVLVDAPAHMRLVEEDAVFAYVGTARAARAVPGIPVARPFSAVLSDPVTLIDTAPDDDTGAEEIVLSTARDVRTLDAAFAVYADDVLIGGLAWDDADADGLRSAVEQPVAGLEVALWELVDGTWTRAEDLDGRGVATTDDDGAYRFRVRPLHYDEGQPEFLQPRHYRVTAQRGAWQEWSPERVGDDPLIDSDMSAPAAEYGTAHTGVSREFRIVDAEDDRADVTTVRDDIHMDMGLRSHAETVSIGGTVWEDTTEDGAIRRGEAPLAGRTVTLWERVGGRWVLAKDATGTSTAVTDARGGYTFTVLPARYDETAADYLEPRVYRTTVELPQGYRLSAGVETAGVLRDGQAISLTADIVTVDADGRVLVADSRDDRTLDFGFVPVPLAITGGALPIAAITVVAVLLAAGLVLLAIHRRRARRGRTT